VTSKRNGVVVIELKIINLLGLIKWTGTLLAIAGALVVSMDTIFSGYGFIIFAVSSLLWLSAGWMMQEMSIVLLNSVFILIDGVGIYRWLIV